MKLRCCQQKCFLFGATFINKTETFKHSTNSCTSSIIERILCSTIVWFLSLYHCIICIICIICNMHRGKPSNKINVYNSYKCSKLQIKENVHTTILPSAGSYKYCSKFDIIKFWDDCEQSQIKFLPRNACAII